jgi:hypothetical protein
VSAADGPIPLDTGALTPEQVRLVLNELQLDVTFVDEHNVIRYYSERFRIFNRAPEDIGTDVVGCHSPGTRSRVERLLSELASGWRDSAEFLEKKGERLVDVRYVALRDETGTYRGCLEIAGWAE